MDFKKEVVDHDDNSNDSVGTVKLDGVNFQNTLPSNNGVHTSIRDSFQSPVDYIKTWEAQMKDDINSLKMQVDNYKKELAAAKQTIKETEDKLLENKMTNNGLKNQLTAANTKISDLEVKLEQSRKEKQELQTSNQRFWNAIQKEMETSKLSLKNKLHEMLKSSFFKRSFEPPLFIQNGHISKDPRPNNTMENSAMSKAKSGIIGNPVSKHSLPTSNATSSQLIPPKKVKKLTTSVSNAEISGKSSVRRKSAQISKDGSSKQQRLLNSDETKSSKLPAATTIVPSSHLPLLPSGKAVVYPPITGNVANFRFSSEITFSKLGEPRQQHNVEHQHMQTQYKNNSDTEMSYDVNRFQ